MSAAETPAVEYQNICRDIDLNRDWYIASFEESKIEQMVDQWVAAYCELPKSGLSSDHQHVLSGYGWKLIKVAAAALLRI